MDPITLTALGAGHGCDLPVVMPTRLPSVAHIDDAMSMLDIDGQPPVGCAGPAGIGTVHPATGGSLLCHVYAWHSEG